MKKLYIIRHSKAVEFASDHSDFNRCLADNGIEKATLIAKHLAPSAQGIDLILSSPACRALETARIFANATDYPVSEIITMDPLYHFGGIDYALEIISKVEDHVDTLMLFGHNPTFNMLAWHLCPDFREGMPTSAVVGVTFEVKNWAEAVNIRGDFLTYLTKRGINQ